MQTFPFSDAVVDMLSRRNVRLVYAAELDFKEGMARFHTGTGSLVIDGHTYEGVGDFGDIDSVDEQLNGSSPMSVRLTLSGLSTQVVRDTLQDKCRGRPGRVMLVAYDDNGNYAADILFSGTMDAPNMSYAGNQGENAITVEITDRMVDWQRGGTERWTDENHRARNQGDRFFGAVAQLADWPIWWGGQKNAPPIKFSD